MSSPLAASHFKFVGDLRGDRLCDECHGQYAAGAYEVGLARRGLCDACARAIGGTDYFKDLGVSNWQQAEGAEVAESAEGTGSATSTESAHDFGNRRIDDQFDDRIDYSIRSEKDFPTRAREYLDILRSIQSDLGIKSWAVPDMARCFYKVQGRTFRCKHDHKTTEFRRDKNERYCPRCNRAYRYRMAEEMVTLTRAFGCDFLLRFVFTVPEKDRDMSQGDILDRVNRALRSFFSEADILLYWTILHEFSSAYPPRRNPHVEVFMIPFGLRRTWYTKETVIWRDFKRHVAGERALRIDEVIPYDKWMLSDKEIERLEKEIYCLRAPTMILETSDFTKEFVELQVSGIVQKIREHKHLEDLRGLWGEEFPDVTTELNVFYNYVGLEKAQYHTIPYALRPPFNPEYVVVFDEAENVVYEIDKKTHQTIDLSLEDVVDIFRYDYYNVKTHRIHRMGALSNAVWRHYYRALTSEDPPEDKEGDEVPLCEVCGAVAVELWTNDYGWYDWLKDVFMERNIVVHLLRGSVDFYAYVRRDLEAAELTTSGSAGDIEVGE